MPDRRKVFRFLCSEIPFFEGDGKKVKEEKYLIDNYGRIIETVRVLNGHLKPNGRLLDLGIYPGHIALILGKKMGIRVFGVALTTSEVFEKKMKRNQINIIKSDLDRQEIPFDDGTFDVVLCSEVIEHVIYPEQLLAEIRHVLGPGGMLVLTVPLEKQGSYNSLRDIPLEDLAKLDYAVLKQRYHVKNDHLTFFTEDKIMSMLQFGGFVVVAKEYTYDYEPRSVVHSIMVSILHRLPFGAVHNLTRIFYKKTKQVHHLVVKATLDKEQNTVT